MGLSLSIFVLFTFQFKWQLYKLNNNNWKNRRWCAWDSNLGRQMEGAYESTELWWDPQNIVCHFKISFWATPFGHRHHHPVCFRQFCRLSLSLSWSSFFNLFSKHVSNAWREEFALLLIIQKLFFSFIWASFFTFQQILITSRRGIALKIQQTVNVASLSSIAQWIRLRLPSCHPGFKSQAHHLRFYHL